MTQDGDTLVLLFKYGFMQLCHLGVGKMLIISGFFSVIFTEKKCCFLGCGGMNQRSAALLEIAGLCVKTPSCYGLEITSN